MEFKQIVISFDAEQKLLRKHNVHAYEVEEVFQNRPHIRFVELGHVHGENLYLALGQTETERYLSVFFINKRKGMALVISARDMDAKERKLYGKIRER